MFPFFYTPIYSTSTGNMALGTGEVNEKNGHIDEGCLLKYAFNGPVAHHGIRGGDRFPNIVQQAAIRRKVQGEESWIGNKGHDLFEDSLLAMADRLKGRAEAPAQAELEKEMWELFSFEWKRSLGYDALSFLHDLQFKRSGEKDPVWLQAHAKSFFSGNPVKPERDYAQYELYREKTAVTADFIAEHLSRMIEDTPFERWAILEGKELENGDVKAPDGMNQAEARAQQVKPSFDVEVDGVLVRVFCTIDFAYWHPNGDLVVADLKTGKVKEAHWEQTGLYGFSIVNQHPEIDPEQIVFRLMYPKSDEFPTRRFTAHELERTQERTKERIRKLLERFVSLNDSKLDLMDAGGATGVNSLQSLSRTYAPRDAQAIWTLGFFKRHGEWPTKLPLLEGQSLHADRTAPTPAEVSHFLIQKLSPIEFTSGLVSEAGQAQLLAEGVMQGVHDHGVKVTNEAANRKIVRRLVPSLAPMDLVSQFSVNHIKIALPENFPPIGAVNTPDWCPGCVFHSICQPGQEAAEEYRRSLSKKRSK